MNRIGVKSDVRADIQVQVAGNTVTVTGNAVAQDGTIEIESVLSDNIDRFNPVTQLTNLTNFLTSDRANPSGTGTRSNASPPTRSSTNVVTDLTVTAGNRIQVMVNPILRGLITPGTQVGIKINTLEDDFEITGDVILRGGEVQWLNRNFYLREGRVLFTETDAFDPRLTLRAEVRERDVNGDPLRITIQTENQRLSEFEPIYSASPAKSETEIMALLGQNLLGDVDVDNPLTSAVTYGDFFLQLTLLRRIENTLRELLKFDILSMRATWLQNLLNDRRDENDVRQRMTVGSVFNNSTLYVGKYLAEELYFDALMHFLYDESRLIEDPDSSGMIFQPEIGLEINAPFASLRWSFAPEFNSWEQFLSPSAWVPATSITLSKRWDGEKVWQYLKELF
jgi:hypothetical protein